MEKKVLRLIATERARAGLPALRFDDRLLAAARAHSQDMAEHNYLSHVGLNGSTFGDRIKATGYLKPVTENLGKGQASAAAVVKAWMGSPGHRRNILKQEATEAACGVVADDNGVLIWTLVFGAE